MDVELSIFLMGFGKERRGVSTSDAHLGDVCVHMCITASDLCCTEHVSRHWFSQELELTPSPSAQTHICILSREDGHQRELHKLNPSQLSGFLVKIPQESKKYPTSVQPLLFVLPSLILNIDFVGHWPDSNYSNFLFVLGKKNKTSLFTIVDF